MQKVGIDAIAFYTANYAMDLATLAKARGLDAEKYYSALGQRKMSVAPPDEDIVTLAANAGLRVLNDVADLDAIELLLFATESGIDQSKAAGIYVHDLLGLSPRCRVVELKQVCYAATFALQLALPFLRQYPDKKVLLIASDISRYGLETPGEPTQGCAAVAMVLSANPRILAFDTEYGVVTENAMDFWRPNYRDTALVEGKYSSKLYLTMLEKSWQQYCTLSGRDFTAHNYYCYHVSVARLVEKAHQHLAKINGHELSAEDVLQQQLQYSLEYGRYIGNSYTASLYVGLISLLDHANDLTNKRIGFYSYGSGCVAEYFSGVVLPNYKKYLHTEFHQTMLRERTELDYADYVRYFNYELPKDGSEHEISRHEVGQFRLARLANHKRIYERVL